MGGGHLEYFDSPYYLSQNRGTQSVWQMATVLNDADRVIRSVLVHTIHNISQPTTVTVITLPVLL